MQKKKLLLSIDNNGKQYDEYKPLLDNLLKNNNGVINIDFINNFFRYIYYDLEGTFEIKKNQIIIDGLMMLIVNII